MAPAVTLFREPKGQEPGTHKDSSWHTRWDNLRLAVLCIGVQEYPREFKLENPVRDAEAMYNEVNKHSRCRAAILQNPKNTSDIYNNVRKHFLEPLSMNPPEVVALIYGGHGKQVENKLYMIPTHAKFEDEDDCKNTCLSHLEVFQWLKKFVDGPAMVHAYRASAAGSSSRPPVKFLLIMDMCRDLFGTSTPYASPSIDPLQDAAPEFWSMCLSTSCGSVADDGDSQTHSPFIQALLDATHGIGASFMPLKKGIEWACSRMDAKGRQRPVTTALNRIPSAFCLNEKRSSPDAGSSGVGSAGASVMNEISPAVVGDSSGSVDTESKFELVEGKRRADDTTNSEEGCAKKRKRLEDRFDAHSSGLHGASGVSKRPDSKAGDDVATKKPRLQDPHAGEGRGGGGDGQGSGGGCAASLDSTQQAFPYDVFISHTWDKDDDGRDNHERAKRLNAGLQHFGLKTWFDEEQMQGNILNRTAQGISGSAVILICVTRRYMDKVAEEASNSCKWEFEFANQRRTDVFMLPVVMEESMTDTRKWDGSLGLVLGRHSFQKLTSDVHDEFDKAVSEIAAAVRKRKRLPNLQQHMLVKGLQDTAHSMCFRDFSPTPSDESGNSTAPHSPSPPSQEVIGIHVESPVSQFIEDMEKFIQDFLKPSDQPAPRKWKLCELLIVAFMREKGSDDPEIVQVFDAWRAKCFDPTVNLMDEFHEMMLALEPPIFRKINHEFLDALSDGTPNGKPFPFSGGKRNHISIFVIDWMVQHSDYRLDKYTKSEWAKKKVVLQWFNPNNTDSADDFLDRAEPFLRTKISFKDQTWGTKILGKVIKTNSYVVFFRMEALAALLLREDCNQQQQQQQQQQQMQVDSEETAPKASSTWPLAITLMVSSSNWHLPFTKAEGPSDDHVSEAERPGGDSRRLTVPAHVSEIVGRLRRIACLPSEVLEDNECSLDKASFVDWEPLYDLKASERAEATSMPSSDSGGASSGPSPAADAIHDYEKEMKGYVEDFKRRFGSYEDAASGEKLKIDEMSISVQASLSEPGKDLPEFLTEAHGLNAEDAPHDAERMRQLTKQRETSRRNGAEGEEERRMFLRRFGYDVSKGADASSQAVKSDSKVIESGEMLLHRLLKGHFMCLIGPPASGKTVTMLQVACAAAEAMQRRVDMGLVQDTLPPRIPIFLRAAELSTLFAQTGNDTERPNSLEALVKLYVRARYPNQKHPRISEMLKYFLEARRVLILIDGLDEAAGNRHVIERMIDDTAGANDVCLMVSTRDYAFETSRMQARFGGFETLGAFEAFTILPLDEQRRDELIERRLKKDRQDFHSQLVTVMKDTPEMATSPFLLALMIQVFKKDHEIPAKRSELYNRQVDGILLRYAPFRHLIAPSVAESSASLKYRVAHMIFHNKELYQQAKSRTDCLEALRTCFRAKSNDGKSPISLREFVEVLAFVCQMQVKTRDFRWSEIQAEVENLWNEAVKLEDVSKFVLDLASVGLLSRVGEGEYRFSHLTLQEYLAASFVVNRFGHDAKELLDQFKPFHSPWKRMVLQFAACMLSEQVFEGFCQLVLASDDETGSHCELVQDFLQERGASENVEQMLRDKLQEIRGSERLIAGLCHPSLELRNIVLSEMKKFGVPPDPFAETDGTAAALRQIAEDGASKWHNRAAALLSLAQMAQMDHCRKGNGRSDTLQWLLGMLTPDQNEDIRFALVKGLGTLLKGFNEAKDEIMLVAAEDEPVLLGALKQSANGVVVEAVADLKAYSDGLIDWVSNESTLIAEGVWPMRHLLHVFCSKTATEGNQGRAEKLGQQLFGRVHAVSEGTFKKEIRDVLKGLDMICPAMRDDRLPLFLHLLRSGEVKQRSRVVQVAAELSKQFISKCRESLDTLAQALLSDVHEGCTLADLMEGGSLLAALLSDESDDKHEGLRQSSKVFVYLMESLRQAADQGLEAPKRVVDFLVEFEKNVAAAGNRNATKTIEKSEDTNPEEKRTEDLSLEILATAVEDFTPNIFSTSIRQPETPLSLYCAARLWTTSGLMQERTSEEIAVWLSLSEAMAIEAEDAFTNLQGLKEPWVSGHGCKDGRWLQNVLEGMRDETQCLGRFMFRSVLEYIRERQCSMKDMSCRGIEEVEVQMRQWQPSYARGQLEQQLLLKEVRIGRRSEELPSWTGVVRGGDGAAAASASASAAEEAVSGGGPASSGAAASGDGAFSSQLLADVLCTALPTKVAMRDLVQAVKAKSEAFKSVQLSSKADGSYSNTQIAERIAECKPDQVTDAKGLLSWLIKEKLLKKSHLENAVDSVGLKHVTRDRVDHLCHQITTSWPRTRREIPSKKAVKRSQSADSPETQGQKNRKGGGAVDDALSNAQVVDGESEAEGQGVESSVADAAPHHMQAKASVSSGGGGSAATVALSGEREERIRDTRKHGGEELLVPNDGKTRKTGPRKQLEMLSSSFEKQLDELNDVLGKERGGGKPAGGSGDGGEEDKEEEDKERAENDGDDKMINDVVSHAGVKRGNVTSIEGVKRGNVTSTSVSKFESSFGENATSTSLHILDLAVSVDGQIVCDSAKAIAGNATKHAIRVNAEAERQESKRVEDDKTEKKEGCIAKWDENCRLDRLRHWLPGITRALTETHGLHIYEVEYIVVGIIEKKLEKSIKEAIERKDLNDEFEVELCEYLESANTAELPSLFPFPGKEVTKRIASVKKVAEALSGAREEISGDTKKHQGGAGARGGGGGGGKRKGQHGWGVSGKAGKGKQEYVRSGPRSEEEEKVKGRQEEHREDSDDSDDSIDSIHRKIEELERKKARQEAKARAAAAEEKRLADEKAQADRYCAAGAGEEEEEEFETKKPNKNVELVQEKSIPMKSYTIPKGRCWECNASHSSYEVCRSAPPLGKGHTGPAYRDDPRYPTQTGGGSRYGLMGAAGGGLGGGSGGEGGGGMGGGSVGGGGGGMGGAGGDGMGGGPAGGGGMGGGGDIDTQNSATLIPANLVSFCKNKGGFTPIYEPEDGCSYGTYSMASVHAMASVNAGAFRLYVGGSAMNKGFALMLKGERHDVDGYEDIHWNFYDAVDKNIQGLHRSDPHTAQRVQRQLHFLSESELRIEPVEGTHDMCLLLSSLPDRFKREGVRAGTIFIDTFKETHRPCKNKANNAMIYCVGPEGDQARDAEDFMYAVKETGQNLFRAVRQYNQPTANRVPIDFVRVCLVSGGLFRHPEVSKVEVAEALISGISAGFLEGARSEAQEEGGRIHFNFAFDENVFQNAYNQLNAR